MHVAHIPSVHTQAALSQWTFIYKIQDKIVKNVKVEIAEH